MSFLYAAQTLKPYSSHHIYMVKSLQTSTIRGPGHACYRDNRGALLEYAVPRMLSSFARGREAFAPPNSSSSIKSVPPAWPHPKVTEEHLSKISVAHRSTKTTPDRIAYGIVRALRRCTDLATGYRHDPDTTGPYSMSERKWLLRFIFLETVAGVPGMVAGMLRHFRSLRRMQRDQGWIETLLEDAHNERMHLLTFLQLARPGRVVKFMVLASQGIFSNAFFIGYFLAPQTAHRFVGYLEEEAVKTYTVAIKDIDNGKLPLWENLQAPEIAVKYWRMPETKRSMRDLLLYIRADEAKHREIHHTFGNLNQAEDPNPFISEYRDPKQVRPSLGIEQVKPTGWDRHEVI